MWSKIRAQFRYLTLSGGGPDSAVSCSLCQSPVRQVWVPGMDVHFRLTTLADGHGISLKQCPECQRLWCYAVYEPLSAFSYSVRWLLTQADWRALHDHDEGATLRDWFDAALQTLHDTLSAEDKAQVEQHRQRAYGLTPFDRQRQHVPDLKRLLRELAGA